MPPHRTKETDQKTSLNNQPKGSQTIKQTPPTTIIRRTKTVTKLDDLLDTLKDEKWHSLTTLAKTLNIPPAQLEQITTQLAQQNIIQHQKQINYIKINPNWKTILTQPEEEAITPLSTHKPSLATLIIPPQETITIQNIKITNTTNKDLELWIKTCKKLTELAITKIE